MVYTLYTISIASAQAIKIRVLFLLSPFTNACKKKKPNKRNAKYVLSAGVLSRVILYTNLWFWEHTQACTDCMLFDNTHSDRRMKYCVWKYRDTHTHIFF